MLLTVPGCVSVSFNNYLYSDCLVFCNFVGFVNLQSLCKVIQLYLGTKVL